MLELRMKINFLSEFSQGPCASCVHTASVSLFCLSHCLLLLISYIAIMEHEHKERGSILVVIFRDDIVYWPVMNVQGFWSYTNFNFKVKLLHCYPLLHLFEK